MTDNLVVHNIEDKLHSGDVGLPSYVSVEDLETSRTIWPPSQERTAAWDAPKAGPFMNHIREHV